RSQARTAPRSSRAWSRASTSPTPARSEVGARRPKVDMDKPELIAAFRTHLASTLADLTRESGVARGGTRVDGTHRPENRGERAAVTAQGYLTAGLEQRAAELRAHLDHLDAIDPSPRERVSPGALVQ